MHEIELIRSFACFSSPARLKPNRRESIDMAKFSCNSQDVKHSEPTLKVLNVSKDMYVVKSGSTLSALQSFAIAVATIHSQTPDLYPNL